jgi:uncharacterized membrane protein
MSDTPAPQAETPSPTPSPSSAGGPQLSEKEIADGKTMAILSYALNFVNLPFWIIPLVQRDNEFSLYHAKQCLVAFIFLLPSAIIAGLSLMICVGAVLLPAVILAGLVLNVMGVMNASKGVCVPLPVIGKFGEKWFAGMVKKTA